ncbi:MAG: type II toxin-antitoxin system RelE/ParE family toxin [Acidimicrobiales bacterium]
MWTVVYLPAAQREHEALPARERHALYNAVAKLQALGPALGYPHTSAVQGAQDQLRELRPRAGRSPWRGLYRLIGDRFVIAAIAPEAQHDLKGFTRACEAAAKRLSELEE